MVVRYRLTSSRHGARPGPAAVVAAVAVVLLGVGTVGCSRSGEGSADGAPATAVDGSSTTLAPVVDVIADPLPPGDLFSSADGSPPRLGGRYGSAQYGSVVIDIIEVAREQIGVDTTRLSVTMTLTNLDRVNQAEIETSRFEAHGLDGSVFEAQVSSNRPSLVLGPGSRATRTIGFVVPAAVPLSAVDLEYGPETVPAVIPVLVPPAGLDPVLPFPLDAELSTTDPLVVLDDRCRAPVELVPFRATVDLQLPLGVARPASVGARAPAGSRWVTLELLAAPVGGDDRTESGALRSGTARSDAGLSGTGRSGTGADGGCSTLVVRRDRFAISVDGSADTMAPSLGSSLVFDPTPDGAADGVTDGAGRGGGSAEPGAGRDVVLAWAVPVGAREVALVALDPVEPTELSRQKAITITLPEPVPVPGEE